MEYKKIYSRARAHACAISINWRWYFLPNKTGEPDRKMCGSETLGNPKSRLNLSSIESSGMPPSPPILINNARCDSFLYIVAERTPRWPDYTYRCASFLISLRFFAWAAARDRCLIIYRPNRRLSYQERISRRWVAASCRFLASVAVRLLGRRLGSALSCRKICKWGPLSDTCRLIFADRTAGATGRCLASCPGPSKCPVTQIRAFVGPRRPGDQDSRTWHSYACAAHAPFRLPPFALSFSLSCIDAPLRSSPGLCIRSVRSLPPPAPLALYLPLPASRIVTPEGPRNPAGCVCYPASCLRTRVVKKILATGGWGGG